MIPQALLDVASSAVRARAKYVSLHDGPPPLHELQTRSYRRLPIEWDRAGRNALPLLFTPGAAQVTHIGFWDAPTVGNFAGGEQTTSAVTEYEYEIAAGDLSYVVEG